MPITQKTKDKRIQALAIVLVYGWEAEKLTPTELYQRCAELGYAWDEDAQVWVQEDALGRKVRQDAGRA